MTRELTPVDPDVDLGVSPCQHILISKKSHSIDKDHASERDALLLAMRGQTIRIPDLHCMFRHWPTETSDQIGPLRDDVRSWLSSTLPSGKSLNALQSSDFGLFGATWWPFAEFDELRIVTYFAIWLFVWDDEIDHCDGTLWSDSQAARVYREQTLAYVRYSLELSLDDPDVTNHIILNFEPIGAAIRERYPLEKRHVFYDEIRYFINKTELEEHFRNADTIPSLEEYWRYRFGSSAVFVCLALNEFSFKGMDLPVEFYSDPDVRAIFRCTNVLVVTVNDLLSIKKEIQRNAIDSLVPIIFSQTKDLHEAVEYVIEMIRAAIEDMDKVCDSLLRKYEHDDSANYDQVKQFLDGCKAYTTGNVTWSLETGRYGVGNVRAGQDIMISL